jgi:hypothetical protein
MASRILAADYGGVKERAGIYGVADKPEDIDRREIDG